MMKITSVKYMRDFYPAEMRLREWIEGNWRAASERAGFEPWDAPIVEKLDLYKRKSGDEIVGQLYTITTRGGEELAIRPEMTPSLARMVSARQAALPRPIKWYCVARMCRYERGQRGRLREFWQWNIDLLGVPGPIADAEVISVALDGLAACGLTADDIEVRINSRSLMGELLLALGIPADRHGAVYAVTDKRGKVPAEDLEKMYRELGFDPVTLERLLSILACGTLGELKSGPVRWDYRGSGRLRAQLSELFECLSAARASRVCPLRHRHRSAAWLHGAGVRDLRPWRKLRGLWWRPV
ncbi:MAG: ATP phosphoribosyltransferase regulatory subunit [Planctomycetota bacterium]